MEAHRLAQKSLIDDDGHDDDISFARPHPSFRPGLRKNVPWKVMGLIAFAAIVSMTLITVLVHDTEDLQCLINPDKEMDPEAKDGDKTKMIIVANLLISFIFFVLSGAPVEITLLFLGALAVLFGALEADELFKGVSSNAVVLLGLLFPIMKAMGDTGYPDRFIGWFMGNPKSLRPAILNMFFAVAILSGIFNNTPIVVMMIPVLTTYCQRLNFDHKAMLMPLSYASQAGGNLTLLGTSINLVALQIFQKVYEIGFFTLTMGAIVVTIVNALYCSFMAPILLARKDFGAEESANEKVEQHEAKTMEAVQQDLGKRNLFNVAVVVQWGSPLIGCAVKDCGIHRVKGVFILHRVLRIGNANPEAVLEMGDSPAPEVPVSTANLRESLRSWQARPSSPFQSLTAAGYHVFAEGWDIVSSVQLQAGDIIQVAATAEGIAQLRQVRGIELGNESTELVFLGAERRQRCLAEAAVGDSIIGQRISVLEWKRQLDCGVVAIRSMRSPTLCKVTFDDYTIERGDVLLLETFQNNVGSDAWLDTFGIVRIVRNSMPPRTGRKNDTVRAIATCIGLLAMVSLGIVSQTYKLDQIGLVTNATLLAVFLIIIKGITVKEAYSEINAPVLFTIVGALAMGKAMEQTRLANCIASLIVSAFNPLGKYGILCGVYISTVGLGQFLNSQGNVALMGTIAIPLAKQMDMEVSWLAMVVVYAASACYMAPYGYQTNTLVMKPGDYKWGDYIKFGGALQLVHLIVVVAIVPLCARYSP